MDKIILKAPAKVNLSLLVLGRRSDGYHEIESVLATLDLADELAFSLGERDGTQVGCRGPWAGEVPVDAANLVWQAAALVEKEASKVGFRRPDGAKIELFKCIPAAAGLGGGSADAAATLRGLNRLWHLGWGEEKLEALAARLGSDVPFLVRGGTGLAQGRGERVKPVRSRLRLHLVLIKPPWGVSTPAVYRGWDAAHPQAVLGQGKGARSRLTRGLIEALEAGDETQALGFMVNDLEPITMGLYPQLQAARQALASGGALKVMVCGSGPTQMGIMDSPEAAREVASRLSQQFRGWWVQVACSAEPS